MRQQTLPFPWNVSIFRHPEEKTPLTIMRIEAISPKQAVRRAASERSIIGYRMERSEECTYPSKIPRSSS